MFVEVKREVKGKCPYVASISLAKTPVLSTA
jgi:hypothetical protein